MSFAITPEKTLTSAVAQAGTFTLDYPANTTVDDYGIHAPNHVLSVSGKRYTSSDDFSVAFGASSITVTWKNSATIPVGQKVRAQLDKVGGDFQQDDPIVFPPRVRPQHVVEVHLGAPDASDDDYFFANAAATGAANFTLLQTTLDVPRNIIITSSGNDSGVTFTVTGADEYGATMIETITGANAGIAAGVKAFKTITTIARSGSAAANVKIGFGDVLGLPIWLQATGAAYKILERQDGAAATAGTFVAGLARATQSTATTADVRGTYDPNAACDGAKVFDIVMVVEDPTYKGNAQYDG